MKNSEIQKPKETLEKIYLEANQIITLKDYPVHSMEALKAYYAMAQKGLEIPPVLVMKISNLADPPFQREFKEFRKTHPEAEYIIMDGSHRTTVGYLTVRQIPAAVIESDRDIKLAFQKVEDGEIFGLPVATTFKECINNLVKHFNKEPIYQTVQEKAERMVRETVEKDKIPQYMIDNFLQLKKDK